METNLVQNWFLLLKLGKSFFLDNESMSLLSGNSWKLDKMEVLLIINRSQTSDPVITELLKNTERKVMKHVSRWKKHIFTLRIYCCKDLSFSVTQLQ